MSHIQYGHSKLTPIALAIARALVGLLARRLGPALRKLLPGEKGRRAIAWILWTLGLVVQGIMLWLLSELVHLCVQLYELWAFLAEQFVEK